MIVPGMPVPRQLHILAHACKFGAGNESAEETSVDNCAASFGIFRKPDLEVLVLPYGEATVDDDNSCWMSEMLSTLVK